MNRIAIAAYAEETDEVRKAVKKALKEYKAGGSGLVGLTDHGRMVTLQEWVLL